MGRVLLEGVDNQLQYPLQAYQQIAITGTRVWQELPRKKEKTLELTSIIQGPDELYQEFVACLLQNLGRTVADTKAGNILVKQLAFEIANKACKTALWPYRKRTTLQEMIRICVDVGLSHIQSIDLAAALKEMFHPGGRKKGACFSCGKVRHFAKECQNKPQPQLSILGPITGPPTGTNGSRT
jgi:hypothetical protein